MSVIRLEWAQFGDFDSFDVLRSESPIDIDSLPSPLVTGLHTMFYRDDSVVEGSTYYYRVRVWRDGLAEISTEIAIRASVSDEYWDEVSALLNFDGNLNNLKPALFIPYNSVVYTSGKFNSAIHLSSNGYIESENSTEFGFGSGDFTIEFFADITTNSGYGCLFDNRYGGNGCGIYAYNSNGIAVASNADVILLKTFTGTGYQHIAICRATGIIYLFVGGILLGTISDSRVYAASASVTLGKSTVGQYFNGKMDEFRVTKGAARYTADFTPPNAPFPGS